MVWRKRRYDSRLNYLVKDNGKGPAINELHPQCHTFMKERSPFADECCWETDLLKSLRVHEPILISTLIEVCHRPLLNGEFLQLKVLRKSLPPGASRGKVRQKCAHYAAICPRDQYLTRRAVPSNHCSRAQFGSSSHFINVPQSGWALSTDESGVFGK